MFLHMRLNYSRRRLRTAFVYASIAAGTCIRLCDAHGKLLGREINPTVYTTAEFDKKRAANDPFLKQVLDKPKLFVSGNSNELGKVAG